MLKRITIICVALALFLTGCSTTTPRVTTWEYKEVSRISEVNTMANQGWDVAGYTAYVDPGNHTHQRYLMKRPKQ